MNLIKFNNILEIFKLIFNGNYNSKIRNIMEIIKERKFASEGNILINKKN